MHPVLYCHGLPGSADDIAGLVPSGKIPPHILGPLDFDGFDSWTQNKVGAHIIGFSLGAMTALQIAATRPEAVSKLTLISAAAPLELGEFLPDMAGRPVFNAAQRSGLAFNILCKMQSLGVALAPDKIISTMFKGSGAIEQALLLNPDFKSHLIAGLKSSLGPKRAPYQSAVRAYVRPWAQHIQAIQCPVALYHGSADNWTPPAMMPAIAAELKLNNPKLKGHITTTSLSGLGHYSTLHHVFPDII